MGCDVEKRDPFLLHSKVNSHGCLFLVNVPMVHLQCHFSSQEHSQPAFVYDVLLKPMWWQPESCIWMNVKLQLASKYRVSRGYTGEEGMPFPVRPQLHTRPNCTLYETTPP